MLYTDKERHEGRQRICDTNCDLYLTFVWCIRHFYVFISCSPQNPLLRFDKRRPLGIRFGNGSVNVFVEGLENVAIEINVELVLVDLGRFHIDGQHGTH